MPHIDPRVAVAAEAIRTADALLIGAGAGMGVDSGLPDFRGPEGFWKAYPPFRGRRFEEMSNPRWFSADPELAWGFFGHRLNLYRGATPHDGFAILRKWAASVPLGAFVFTSNVDGQFQKAGFAEDRVFECHGSIRYLQCTRRSCDMLCSSDDVSIDVDPATIRTSSPLPRCRECGELARPNILMFGDPYWNHARSRAQEARYDDWLRRIEGRNIVAVELGAGLAIPTVRMECEGRSSTLIRINPREPEVPDDGIGIAMGALAALTAIDAAMG